MITASTLTAAITRQKLNDMSKNWIKIYIDQCLYGTMMEELGPAQRWIWIGLLLLAGKSNIEGLIYMRKGVDGIPIGYSKGTLAELLGVSCSDFDDAVHKMVQYEKIALDPAGVIEILNWKKYQSEYSRQKGYRKKSNFKCNQSNTPELDKELDKEEEQEKERNAREAHASPLHDPTPTEEEIILALKAVPGYPFDLIGTLEYIRELTIEFPRINLQEEIKKKVAWWKDNPLGKKSNPHLQLRNWMRKATEWAQEAAQDRQVGQTPRAELEKDPIPDWLWQAVAHMIGKAGGDIPDFLQKKCLVFELDENIEAWERIKAKSPEALIGFIKEKFQALPKKRGTTKCPRLRVHRAK